MRILAVSKQGFQFSNTRWRAFERVGLFPKWILAAPVSLVELLRDGLVNLLHVRNQELDGFGFGLDLASKMERSVSNDVRVFWTNLLFLNQPGEDFLRNGIVVNRKVKTSVVVVVFGLEPRRGLGILSINIREYLFDLERNLHNRNQEKERIES